MNKTIVIFLIALCAVNVTCFQKHRIHHQKSTYQILFHRQEDDVDIQGVDDQCLQQEIQSCVTQDDLPIIGKLQEQGKEMEEDTKDLEPTYDNLKEELSKFEDDPETGKVWTCVSDKVDQCKEELEFFIYHNQEDDVDIEGVDDQCLQEEIQSCVTQDDLPIVGKLQVQGKEMEEDTKDLEPTYDNLKEELAKYEDDPETGKVWTCVSDKVDQCKEELEFLYHNQEDDVDIEGVDDQCLQEEIQSCVTQDDLPIIGKLQVQGQQMEEDTKDIEPTYDNLKEELAKYEDDPETGKVWTCISDKVDSCKEELEFLYHNQEDDVDIEGVDDQCLQEEIQSCVTQDDLPIIGKLQVQGQQMEEDTKDIEPTYDNLKEELAKYEDDPETGKVWTCISDKVDQCQE